MANKAYTMSRMQENFMECELGALTLYGNIKCPFPHFKSNRIKIILHLYVFRPPSRLISQVKYPELMIWRHAAMLKLIDE